MTQENGKNQALVPLGQKSSTVSQPEVHGSVLQHMVHDALEIARRQSHSVPDRHLVGDYELCEPDYRQVLLWAERLLLPQKEIMARLSRASWRYEEEYYCEWETPLSLEIIEGHIRTLVWNSEELPLTSFEWVPGLHIEVLAITKKMPAWASDQRLTSLRRLFVKSLGLGHLYLTQFPRLLELCCADNQLTKLDITHIPELTVLDCGCNQLTSLELEKVVNLTELYCYSNQLASLDLSSVPRLTHLDCSFNHITELNLNTAVDLTSLECEGTHLKQLDITLLHELAYLDCRCSKLVELNFGHAPRLTVVQCQDNQLFSLNISLLPNLLHLYCEKNNLTTLNLSNAFHLHHLSCSFNKLITLDLSSLPNLITLNCTSNPLTSLDLRPVPKLKNFYVDNKVQIKR